MKWYLTVISICISLIVNDVQHHLIRLWPSLYLLWKNVYSGPLPIFSSDFLLFLYWAVWVLYIFLIVLSLVVVITKLHPTLCNSMDCSMPGFPVHHQHPEPVQTHAHWVSNANQPSHTLSSPSLPDFNLSQHQGLFKWVSSSHQVAKVLELQLQHQSFQWIFKTDFP